MRTSKIEFEAKRRAMFARKAVSAGKYFDGATGLVSPPPQRHDKGAHTRAAGSSVLDTASAATAFAMTDDFDSAWKALTAVLNHQDKNPSSLTYGNFFWYSEWKIALDPNAVSFIAPHLCYILRRCGGRMPDKLRRRLESALRLSFEGLNAHRATWGYTNIALLNIASKLMIGDVLNDPRALKIAAWDWEEWRNHTARLGAITEYNTLTYTAVQIDALALMLTCAKAPPQFLREARAVMRHLIAASVMDHHPAIGRITGAQSRAYLKDRRLRGAALMDVILHFVLNTPAPVDSHAIWLGAPIGKEDLPAYARKLPLPRTTRAVTHGCTRMNYLARDFALGSVSGRNHWSGNAMPFFLAYRARTPRCTAPIMPFPSNAEGCFSTQCEGRLLAVTQWLFARPGGRQPLHDDNFGSLSGLCTGRPDNLVRGANIRPGYDMELGLRQDIKILDGQGREITDCAKPFKGATVAVETESVCFCARFFGLGRGIPALTLREDADGEVILTIRVPPEGRVLNGLERACFCAVYLEVVSRRAPRQSAEMAKRVNGVGIHASFQDNACGIEMRARGTANLTLSFPFEPAWMYSANGNAVTSNQWCLFDHGNG